MRMVASVKTILEAIIFSIIWGYIGYGFEMSIYLEKWFLGFILLALSITMIYSEANKKISEKNKSKIVIGGSLLIILLVLVNLPIYYGKFLTYFVGGLTYWILQRFINKFSSVRHRKSEG